MTNELACVINWFLHKESMTPKKLQKLLYYSYSWYLVLENEEESSLNRRLFNERFEAWTHGPAIHSVYEEYRNQPNFVIEKPKDTIVILDESILDILDQIWEVYGHYNGNQLTSIAQQEDPWLKAHEGHSFTKLCREIIADKEIYNYYSKRIV